MAVSPAGRRLEANGDVTMAGVRQYGMVDVFVEARPASAAAETLIDIAATGCLELHRVAWQESFVSEEGRRMICHFRAPDAESVRLAFRQGGVPVESVWTGTVHDDGTWPVTANLVVERTLLPVLAAAPEVALEHLQTELLKPSGLQLARAIVISARSSLVCACRAPDASAVRLARTLMNAAIDRVWTCRQVFRGPI